MILDDTVFLNKKINNKNAIIPADMILEILYSYKKPVSKNEKEIICARTKKANMNFIDNL
jgi:hypothetical protein